ncbi:GTP-binding protein [Roseomonas sp. AR75]|uniref:flagellar biosynthesis protein FlhF n=1 Tax=Roseomonas sp. AR75 TaxID=2562311 RepID=UPI001F0FE795|nr:GTP-binding protein [Roseomonas sp. AR75]
MSEAMATLRAELGEEAVILGTRRIAGGVEVTAAQESTDDEPLVIAPDAARAASAIPAALHRHNLPATLAQRLAGGALDAAIARVFRFEALPLDGPALLLAGPPGAGKTTSCAKLATRLVLAGTKPLLVSADGRRAGAAEQLAAFARVLDLPLAIANSPAALAKALARRAAGQPALVDMPGCDPFDDAAARRHAALAEAAQGRQVLVLPAGLDAEEAAETARAFHLLGCRHLLPTRLDAARRLGGVLAAAASADLAFTEAGTGMDIATGLTPLAPGWLAQRLAQGAS